MKCCCTKFVFLSLSILLALGALVVVTFGYVLPLINSGDYTLQSCKVASTRITHPSNYHGMVTLGYMTLMKEIDVFDSNVQLSVEAYLKSNYKVGIMVQCLVSGDDIQVSIFISNVGLVFTIIIAIASVICFGVFIIIHICDKHKRKNYVELEERKNRQTV